MGILTARGMFASTLAGSLQIDFSTAEDQRCSRQAFRGLCILSYLLSWARTLSGSYDGTIRTLNVDTGAGIPILSKGTVP